MSVKCPYCGSDKIQTERRLDGFHRCVDCQYSWKLGSSLPKQTVFDQITASQEVLAEDMVYSVGKVWASTLIVDTTFDSYEEAIAATVEKLKEVAE